MAFFDDLSKKITQAGQAVSQKSKDISGVAKLNSAISAEEKKLQANYYQLGRLYVTKHGNDFEPSFADLVNAIKESEQNIINYRTQIQDIKGIMRCEKCGAEIPNNVLFCSTCGTPVPVKDPVPNTVRCTACGQTNSKDTSFCTKCGSPMNVAPVAPTPAPIATPVPAPVETTIPVPSPVPTPVETAIPVPAPVETAIPVSAPVSATNFCTNCGAKVPQGMAFCQECGTRLI